MDPTSELPEYLSIDGEIARYTPTAEVALDMAVEMISRAIEYCREHDIGGLLVDARELYGFPHPSVVDRYWFIRQWAADAGGKAEALADGRVPVEPIGHPGANEPAGDDVFSLSPGRRG